MYCYLEFKLSYLKNLNLFSIGVKELFEPIHRSAGPSQHWGQQTIRHYCGVPDSFTPQLATQYNTLCLKMIEKIAVVLAFSNEMETSIKRRHSGRTCAVKFCSNSSRNIQIWKKSERQIHKPQAHHECPCPRPYALHRFPGREDAEIPFVNIVNISARTIFKSNLKESNNVRFDCWCHHYFVISFMIWF